MAEVSQPKQTIRKFLFTATGGDQSVMIYPNNESEDNTPVEFKFGGGKYLLESDVSNKSGRLAADELIVIRKVN